MSDHRLQALASEWNEASTPAESLQLANRLVAAGDTDRAAPIAASILTSTEPPLHAVRFFQEHIKYFVLERDDVLRVHRVHGHNVRVEEWTRNTVKPQGPFEGQFEAISEMKRLGWDLPSLDDLTGLAVSTYLHHENPGAMLVQESFEELLSRSRSVYRTRSRCDRRLDSEYITHDDFPDVTARWQSIYEIYTADSWTPQLSAAVFGVSDYNLVSQAWEYLAKADLRPIRQGVLSIQPHSTVVTIEQVETSTRPTLLVRLHHEDRTYRTVPDAIGYRKLADLSTD